METSVEEYGERPAFCHLNKDKTVGYTTYSEAYEEMKSLSKVFISRGYKTVAVMGKNSKNWAITYLAVTLGAMVIVPIDKELKEDEVNNILSVSRCDAVVYGGEVAHVVEKCPHLCDRIPDSSLEGLIEKGREIDDGIYRSVVIDQNALASLVFTSGTSGMAKGVMLSQYNICSDIVGVRKLFYVEPEDRVLSLLPLHHTYACTADFLAILYSGGSIAYLESLRSVTKDLQLYKPTIFMVVPQVLEVMYGAIMKKVNSKKSTALAFKAGRTIAKITDKIGINTKDALYGKVHETFGGKLSRILVGAAPLDPKLFCAFEDMGFKVYCGYGLTETSPICIMHSDFYKSPYNNGMPVSGAKAKICDPDKNGVGELAVKGPMVMLGYYENPKLTNEVIQDGWFYTGDLATVTEDGIFKIVGRCKNMIVLKNGKKVFPEELEYKLGQNRIVKECLVYGVPDGEGDYAVTAEIFPDFDAVNEILASEGITPASHIYYDRVKILIDGACKAANRTNPGFKAIKGSVLRKEEFEKTTTKKIKRYKK